MLLTKKKKYITQCHNARRETRENRKDEKDLKSLRVKTRKWQFRIETNDEM